MDRASGEETVKGADLPFLSSSPMGSSPWLSVVKLRPRMGEVGGGITCSLST